MNEIEKFEHAGRTVRIFQDEDPPNPRKDYDNVSVFACWHSRLNLGDRQIQGCSEEDFRADAEANGEEILALLPIYLYQHSGLTISTTPFGCQWDSGQVGWACVTRASAEKMGCMPGMKFTVNGEERTYDEAFFLEAIRGDVAVYDQYLRGDVYGYTVEGREGDALDSCWGFYGLDTVREEAKEAAAHAEDPATEREVEALQARATYAAG